MGKIFEPLPWDQSENLDIFIKGEEYKQKLRKQLNNKNYGKRIIAQ